MATSDIFNGWCSIIADTIAAVSAHDEVRLAGLLDRCNEMHLKWRAPGTAQAACGDRDLVAPQRELRLLRRVLDGTRQNLMALQRRGPAPQDLIEYAEPSRQAATPRGVIHGNA